MTEQKITTAVIPAAGLGVRFLPLTKSQPKEMLPIVDKPAIQYVVEEAAQAGITDVLVITGRGKRAIEDHFDRNFELDYALTRKEKFEELEKLEEIESLANIHYIRQRDALGLGHAISVAKSHVGNDPFVVMLGDDIMVDDAKLLKRMINDFDDKSASIVALMEVSSQEISSYGCADVTSTKSDSPIDCVEIKGFVEKPDADKAPSNLAVSGRYIFTNEIFDALADTKPGYGGEIQLTDAMVKLLESEKVFGRVFAAGRFDIGQKVDWLLANVKMALQREDLNPKFRQALLEVLKQEDLK